MDSYLCPSLQSDLLQVVCVLPLASVCQWYLLHLLLVEFGIAKRIAEVLCERVEVAVHDLSSVLNW